MANRLSVKEELSHCYPRSLPTSLRAPFDEIENYRKRKKTGGDLGLCNEKSDFTERKEKQCEDV
ncbi:unnamed protein product [Orchesella dallaii]|uniref:Uncharacterized protein n=1 Tax=Orchesella dallaii TaxID=48710 RepID=A0ABP1QFB2_9HEXA